MTCATMDVEDVHSVLSVMQKNLECPICLDLMKEPVATRCDHIFCRFCMLQLLSKKKRGRAQCPMCKKEVTKRSLQDSPRFKLLVDGLLKIINAFELDSGYKFFPSQDYASAVAANHKEAPKKDEQPVVRSTGYRNRTKRGIVNRGHCEDQLSLLETSADTPLTRDADARNCKTAKRQKKKAKQLITDFVSDSSEDDLFQKAGSLGSEVDEPAVSCDLGASLNNCLMAKEANDPLSSKLESDDVAASDQAEYGFSERDLESIRSTLWSIDGVRPLKDSPSENSAILTDPLISNKDSCKSEHVKPDESGRNLKRTEPNANMAIKRHQYSERQTLKIAIDDQYDNVSTPENTGSTQDSPRDTSCTVSKHQVKKSIKKVKEWFLKTDELLNNSSRDDEFLPDVSCVEDQDDSDKCSSLTDETELMAVSHRHVVTEAVEKSMVNVEDQIFGRVYKRERKPNPVGKVTCVADVHVNGAGEQLIVNEVFKTANLKPKRSTGLQPEDFIKKVEEKEQRAASISSDPVIVDDFGLDTGNGHLIVQSAVCLDADKIEVIGQDLEPVLDDQPSKPKKSLKRKSEKIQSTRTMQSLKLTNGKDVGSCQEQSPLHIKIDSYPSNTEPGNDVSQKNVRRSKRLNLVKENISNQMATDNNGKDIRNGEPQIDDPPNNISTMINSEKPEVSEDPGHQINGNSLIAVQKVTIGRNGGSHMEYDSSQMAKDIGSSTIPKQNAETLVNAPEMEDSDLDTQFLLKTFKSAKRMSFKLDPVTKIPNKENCDPVDISDIGTSFTNGQRDKGKPLNGQSLCKPNEDIHCESQCKNLQENQPKPSRSLRSKKNYRLSSKRNVKSSAKNTDKLAVHTAITTEDQLSNKDIEALQKCHHGKNAAVNESEGPLLPSESESMSLCPIVTHQNLAASMRGDTRSGSGQGENEQARNDSYQKCRFEEEQVNQITSSNSSQGSMTVKLLGHTALRNSSPCKSPEVDSDTPDGLLGNVDREDTSCCVVAEKSFVFGDGKKSESVDCSVSPVNQSQVERKRKRSRAQKLESSEEESSGDDELPSFSALLGNASTIVNMKNLSASSSPKKQGGGAMAMFSSCSTSGKTQTSFSLPHEAMAYSQESQRSVNLFSSQSNTSDHSINGAPDHNGARSQHRTQESSLKRPRVGGYCNNEEMVTVENDEEEMTNVENDCDDPVQEQNFGEVSGCDSEASHTGDSSGLSSQCEILSTQQRDAMRNNLENLQREMAALEAVLEQHGSRSLASARERASAEERVTIRPQEAPEKQADDEGFAIAEASGSPDTIPETVLPSGQGLQSPEEPPPVVSRSRSPTPPLSLPPSPLRKKTPEKIQALFNVFKDLKESTVTDGEVMDQEGEDVLHAAVPDNCAPNSTNLTNSRFPKQILRSKLEAVNGHSPFRRGSTKQSSELKEVVQQPQHASKHPGNTQRSSSPTFTSPLRSKAAPSFKSPVVSCKRSYSFVTSGLSQSEVMLVHKFSRRTQSIFSSQMTESTTHVIMKTDEQLVCERTLKYFLGIAGRKWVVSYEWIVQSFREGRILDEYDYEVKGDVINGRNHRGPRRSRLGSDGLLLTDFEICCLGSFTDMTRNDLECMVSLCGASVACDPSQFGHKSGTTSLVVVQPDNETDYAAMRKKYRCLVITREWLLDSVSSYKLQAFDSYLV
ncbi:breast cancer type 1 susceptibility protein isoform X2 [Eleutherodactylus coqui]|uniref:breast cancer type 1 susceptibility protein isoform X2 n=1 Tax=Eleutherodactylus coqui TaxID=57060 RepID=UPI003461BE36